ncbi:MAG: hypothetical protein IPG93_01185 [Burkholderiales bacterium]|nr:hypothetical protein [Burkholderiales bacterium]
MKIVRFAQLLIIHLLLVFAGPSVAQELLASVPQARDGTLVVQLLGDRDEFILGKVVNIKIPGGEEDPGFAAYCGAEGNIVADTTSFGRPWGNLLTQNSLTLSVTSMVELKTRYIVIETGPLVDNLRKYPWAQGYLDQVSNNATYSFSCRDDRLLLRTIMTMPDGKRICLLGVVDLRNGNYQFAGSYVSSRIGHFLDYSDRKLTRVIASRSIADELLAQGFRLADAAVLDGIPAGYFLDHARFFDSGILLSLRKPPNDSSLIKIVDGWSEMAERSSCVATPTELVGLGNSRNVFALTSDRLLVSLALQLGDALGASPSLCDVTVIDRDVLAATQSLDGMIFELKDDDASMKGTETSHLVIARDGVSLARIELPMRMSRDFWRIYVDGKWVTLIHGPVDATTPVIQFKLK